MTVYADLACGFGKEVRDTCRQLEILPASLHGFVEHTYDLIAIYCVIDTDSFSFTRRDRRLHTKNQVHSKSSPQSLLVVFAVYNLSPW